MFNSRGIRLLFATIVVFHVAGILFLVSSLNVGRTLDSREAWTIFAGDIESYYQSCEVTIPDCLVETYTQCDEENEIEESECESAMFTVVVANSRNKECSKGQTGNPSNYCEQDEPYTEKCADLHECFWHETLGCTEVLSSSAIYAPDHVYEYGCF